MPRVPRRDLVRAPKQPPRALPTRPSPSVPARRATGTGLGPEPGVSWHAAAGRAGSIVRGLLFVCRSWSVAGAGAEPRWGPGAGCGTGQRPAPHPLSAALRPCATPPMGAPFPSLSLKLFLFSRLEDSEAVLAVEGRREQAGLCPCPRVTLPGAAPPRGHPDPRAGAVRGHCPLRGGGCKRGACRALCRPYQGSWDPQHPWGP